MRSKGCKFPKIVWKRNLNYSFLFFNFLWDTLISGLLIKCYGLCIKLFFNLTVISSLITMVLNLAGECRQLLFPSDVFGNKRLTNHSITTQNVFDLDLCELQCYHEPHCVSINFKVIPDREGLHECELNNATHRSHEIDLQNKDGYVYKGGEVRNFDIRLRFILFFFLNVQLLHSNLALAFGFMFRSHLVLVEFGFVFVLIILRWGSCSCSHLDLASLGSSPSVDSIVVLDSCSI